MIFPTIKPTLKQYEGWKILWDKVTNFLGFGGGAGGGKAQPLSSLVLTKKGFVKMGSLKIGDKILTPNNKETTIKGIYPQGTQDIYEVEFIDGVKTQVTKEHLWDCWRARRGQKSRAIRTTTQIMGLRSNILIPLSENLEFGKHYNKIDSYLLGVLLGDGGLTKNNIILTTADKEIIENIKDRIGVNKIIYKGKYRYSLTAKLHNKKGYLFNPLIDILRELGVMGCRCENKFIPKEVKYGSLKNRLEVTRGLLDTDGYISKDGKCYFTSKSKRLAKDLQFIIRSLGGKVTLTKQKKFCMYKGKKREGIYWGLYIRTQNNSELFKLTRKKIRGKKIPYLIGRRIKKIKLIGKKEAQCISIKDKEGLYITDDFIVTHNTWLGCEWLLTNCKNYPGSRWFIGRNELKRLMQSTYVSFQKVCKLHKIAPTQWKTNRQYNYIEFPYWGNSRIDLLDLVYKPSDPNYERYGSLEYTGGWLEEASEIRHKAFDVLKSRVGRHRNVEYGLIPKMLLTFNPSKNFLYKLFYQPWKKDELPKEYAFIQSLYGDNPYTAEIYGKQLSLITDKATKQRLMFGNWEYDDDPGKLMEYDSIIDIFTNTVGFSEEKFLTGDIARFGTDKNVIGLWKGFNLYQVFVWTKQGLDVTERMIRDLMRKEQIPHSHAMVDEGGMGGGLVDNLGIKGFVSNSTALENPLTNKKENFKNLKAQTSYMFAEFVNNHKLAISAQISIEEQNCIIEELDQIRSKDRDKDTKLQLVPKDEVKEMIGRSPDFSDMLIQRMWFVLKKLNIQRVVTNFPNYQLRRRR